MSSILPLLYEGDSYILDLEEDGTSICLKKITRFENNQNSDGTQPRFFDLDESTRDAVLRQIRRRHGRKTVKIQ